MPNLFYESNIGIKTRRDLGANKDTFSGYVFSKDDYPILQLHLYETYYTTFWRGSTSLFTLVDSLKEAVTEISTVAEKSLKEFNRGVARYWQERHNNSEEEIHELKELMGSKDNPCGFTLLYFVIDPQTETEQKIHKEHNQFLESCADQIAFARFDIENREPIILWANAINPQATELIRLNLSEASNYECEVGFSSILPLPEAVLKLFQQSCLVNVTDSELERIGSLLRERLLEGEYRNAV